ncbi:MAG: zinc-ribbon domain-containing protein, partial [Candidatus Aminicenantales bacterium]
MAITRCPYCHSIIDENDKYCNNCGTQLLFSEDEEIEEEIPGEKIIEAVVEEKDYTVDEPADEKRPAAKKDLDAEIDEELEEEPGDQKKPTALDELMAAETGEVEDEDVTKEVILVDEIEAAVAKAKDGSAALDEDEAKKEDEEDAEEEELADELEEDVEEELEEGVKPAKEDETREYASIAAPIDKTGESPPEPLRSSPEEPDIAYVSESETPDDTATAGEAGLRPVTFDSRELENLGKTVDLGREKIDKFLEVITSKEVATGPVPEEPATEKPADPPTGTLPPWASTMRGAPVFPEDTGPVETRKIRGGEPATTDTEEVEIFPRQR